MMIGKGCYPGALNKKEFKSHVKERKVYEKERLKKAMASNLLQHHFKDPTGHLQ